MDWLFGQGRAGGREAALVRDGGREMEREGSQSWGGRDCGEGWAGKPRG